MDLGMNDRQLVLRESTGDLDDDTPARSGPVLSMGMCCLVNRWLGVRVPSSALGLDLAQSRDTVRDTKLWQLVGIPAVGGARHGARGAWRGQARGDAADF